MPLNPALALRLLAILIAIFQCFEGNSLHPQNSELARNYSKERSPAKTAGEQSRHELV
jgi:hypothetical protein